ncbi:hypothetical protein U4960_14820 [Altererythrobacter sp. H2]|uniref:hypothetical protein n=1 Tax=Altererythrobacter sp. H2 TaxID=3108391 RepID=UPI002B4BC994|nr:hypothetical protein [Altererythrobacter sp. H2]WRK95534.1 hypothetical protein U4960_14820 [Altererythrobacter sp. H2]
MTVLTGRTGQPLAVLGGILALWLAGRALLWQSPFPLALPPLPRVLAGEAALADRSAPAQNVPQSVEAVKPPPPPRTQLSPPPMAAAPFEIFEAGALASRGPPIDASSAHQLMWLAALGEGPAAPRTVPAMAARAAAFAPPQSVPPAGVDRWSFSGWLLVRQGASGGTGSGLQPSSYGASQAGGVLRYRLAPGSRREPAAYLRLSGALRDLGRSPGDREAAMGLSLRPFPKVPLALLGEGRLREQGGRPGIRPAVLAVTELAPLGLPRAVQAEAYAQAGYVGGKDATAFADGQVRVTAPLARFDLGAVRAGAGAWGGAQKGAARLDVGPTAQVDLTLGPVPARVALDYRLRVAGDAAPGSGLAVTLSTGF